MTKSASAYRKRRHALVTRCPDRAIVIGAGREIERNIPSIRYPYRASSHFLFFAGRWSAGAVLVVTEEGSHVFLEDSTPLSALWHGDDFDRQEAASRFGIDRIWSRQDLPSLLESLSGLALESIVRSDPQLETLLAQQAGARSHSKEFLDALVDLRLVADELGLEQIKLAVATTQLSLLRAMDLVAPGETEVTVEFAIEEAMRLHGMQPAFPSIVTVRGDVLHNSSGLRPMQAGELLLVDCGAETELGYAADVTRVWPVDGRFRPEQLDAYALVLEAQQTAIAMLKSGVRYRDVHLAAALVMARGLVALGLLRGDPESLVERGAHALFFPHGIGHLLGLDVHDLEDLGDLAGYPHDRKRSSQFGLSHLRLDRDLATGMVVTVEPGFYVNPAVFSESSLVDHLREAINFELVSVFEKVRGIRIEDDVLILDSGSVVLSAGIPRAVDEIEHRISSAT